jgi:hypothetical protein
MTAENGLIEAAVRPGAVHSLSRPMNATRPHTRKQALISTKLNIASSPRRRARRWRPDTRSIAAAAAASGEPGPLLGIKASELRGTVDQLQDEPTAGRRWRS